MSYWMSMEEVIVATLVDTASQSTIISRSLLHKIFCYQKKLRNTLSVLERPCTKFKGRGEGEVEWGGRGKGMLRTLINNFNFKKTIGFSTHENCTFKHGLVLNFYRILVFKAKKTPMTGGT